MHSFIWVHRTFIYEFLLSNMSTQEFKSWKKMQAILRTNQWHPGCTAWKPCVKMRTYFKSWIWYDGFVGLVVIGVNRGSVEANVRNTPEISDTLVKNKCNEMYFQLVLWFNPWRSIDTSQATESHEKASDKYFSRTLETSAVKVLEFVTLC